MFGCDGGWGKERILFHSLSATQRAKRVPLLTLTPNRTSERAAASEWLYSTKSKHPRLSSDVNKKGGMRLIIFFWFRPLRPPPQTTSDLYTPYYYLLSSLEVVSVVTPHQTWEIMLKNPTTCVVRTWSGRGHNTQMDPTNTLKPRPITTPKHPKNSGPITAFPTGLPWLLPPPRMSCWHL